MSNFSDADRIALLLRKNGFTFDDEGNLNKPRECTSFHQNLMLTLFINGGLNLVDGRYRIPALIVPAFHQQLLATV